MTLKSFTIKYNDKEEQIDYEDDISFGDVEYVLKICTDLSDLLKPKVDIAAYRINIIARALRKAPFAINDFTAIEKLPRKVGKEIADKIMADYPLIFMLADWMQSVLGESLNLDQFATQNESMPSVQLPTDGQKAT